MKKFSIHYRAKLHRRRIFYPPSDCAPVSEFPNVIRYPMILSSFLIATVAVSLISSLIYPRRGQNALPDNLFDDKSIFLTCSSALIPDQSRNGDSVVQFRAFFQFLPPADWKNSLRIHRLSVL